MVQGTVRNCGESRGRVYRVRLAAARAHRGLCCIAFGVRMPEIAYKASTSEAVTSCASCRQAKRKWRACGLRDGRNQGSPCLDLGCRGGIEEPPEDPPTRRSALDQVARREVVELAAQEVLIELDLW